MTPDSTDPPAAATGTDARVYRMILDDPPDLQRPWGAVPGQPSPTSGSRIVATRAPNVGHPLLVVVRAAAVHGSSVARRMVRRTGGSDAGQVTPFVVIVLVALFAMAGLVLDGGVALSAKVQALDAAQAAARTGAQQLNLTEYRETNIAQLDPARAQAAARGWLTSAGLDGDVTATDTTVTVTVRRTSRTQLLQLVGVADLHISATATATTLHGITAPGQ